MKMRRLISYILIIMLISPAFIFLAGCGATPVNDIKAVYFDSSVYYTNEENGKKYPVFELDVKEMGKDEKTGELKNGTLLKYKVNPSGWSGPVQFKIENPAVFGGSHAGTFEADLKIGKFNIISEDFDFIYVTISIKINSEGVTNYLEDTCIVKRKVYPNKIYLNNNKDTKATIYLNSHGSYNIPVYGDFSGSKELVPISEKDYNFKVEYVDEQDNDRASIDILDESRLVIESTKELIKTVKLNISLLDQEKKYKDDNYKLQLEVKIIPPGYKAYATIEGYDKSIGDDNKEDINITVKRDNPNTIDNESNFSIYPENPNEGDLIYYCFDLGLVMFGNSENSIVFMDDDSYTIDCISNKEYYRIIDGNKLMIRDPDPTKSESDVLTLDIIILTSVNGEHGYPYNIKFTVNFSFVN